MHFLPIKQLKILTVMPETSLSSRFSHNSKYLLLLLIPAWFLLYKNLPDNKLHSVLFKRRILDGLAALYFLMKGSIRSVLAVWKAHMDFYRHLSELKVKRKIVKTLEVTHNSAPVLNKSIVFEFYVKGNKSFNSLRMES